MPRLRRRRARPGVEAAARVGGDGGGDARRWRTRRHSRGIGGPTGGKSRNEGSYLGGSLSPAITPGSGAARKRGGGEVARRPPRRRVYILAAMGRRQAAAASMTVELYKDEKLMPAGGEGGRRARARSRVWSARGTYRLFCPNPQSLRALMTAHHDPPGKILGDHGAGDIKYAARVESTVMSRATARGGAGI